MKKHQKTIKYKIWIKKSARKKLKSHLIFISHKSRAIKRYTKTKEELIEELRIKLENFKRIKAPDYFSLINFPEESIKFINQLENCFEKKEKVSVELKNLKYLDHSAVTILVSILFSFKKNNIQFRGSLPKNDNLRFLLVNSDFFKYLNRSIPEKLEYKIGKKDQIFTNANKEVNSELGLVIMAEAGMTIFGNPKTWKGLQRTLLELMQNTNNHADPNEKGEKHWWLSVNHNKLEKSVSFIFVDYGVGIFESLKNKPNDNKWFGWFEKIKNKLILGGNEEIFKLLLNGVMHMTVTGEHFRGKGLPGIKQVLDRNQISNLNIISNNVFADVTNDTYKKLNSEFNGTFVSWELNQNNDYIEWVV